MQQAIVYGIKTCGSVQKALKYLESKCIAYTFVDFKQTLPTSAMLKKWVELTGVDILLNTKGTTYKKLGLKDRLFDEEDKILAMLQAPLLIKRPVIEYGKKIIVGFDEKVYQEFFV